MEIAWGKLWQGSSKRLKAGWLITSGLIAIYLGAVEPMNRFREIATQKQTGLGAVAGYEPISMWRQTRPLHMMLQKDVTPGVRDRLSARRESKYLQSASVAELVAPVPPPPGTADNRKTIRTGEMDLVVKSPREMVEKIRQLTERAGGFLVNSEVNGAQDAASASV